jgi:VanZ family protein
MRWFARLVTLIYFLFIAWAVIATDRGTLPEPLMIIYKYPGLDKLAHFVLLGLMTYLLNLSLANRRIYLFSRPVLLGSAIMFVLALLDEFSQIFISTRTSTLGDLASSTLGILCADWLSRKRQYPKDG